MDLADNEGMSAAAPWTTPPTPQHLAELDTARRLGAKIRRAAGAAIFSGWSTAIFAFLTFLVGAASFSFIGSLLGMGMAIVALCEFRGAAGIRKLDPIAPRRLAINQVIFGALLLAYGAISLWMVLSNPSELAGEIGKYPELRGYVPEITELARLIYIAVYGGVMLFAIVGPGLTAWYYDSRRRYIEDYVKNTPRWILDLQRAGMSI